VALPVLGGISQVVTEGEKRQRFIGALGFVAASLGLVVICVGIIAVQGFLGPSA
jgi:hypothetical protein